MSFYTAFQKYLAQLEIKEVDRTSFYYMHSQIILDLAEDEEIPPGCIPTLVETMAMSYNLRPEISLQEGYDYACWTETQPDVEREYARFAELNIVPLDDSPGLYLVDNQWQFSLAEPEDWQMKISLKEIVA